MIDAVASKAHLVDHVAPIWCALPEEMRGTFWVGHRSLVAHAARRGVTGTIGYPHHSGPPVIAANHHDYLQTHAKRPVLYVEHGAGQTYPGTWPDHPSYSGGRDRDRVALFLTLNETTAARERAAYPDTPVAVIGSAHLDALASDVGALRSAVGSGLSSPCSGPAVAFAWHWRCNLLPETQTAFPHWTPAVRALAQSGAWCVLGHGHPRVFAELVRHYQRMGVTPVRDLRDVLGLCHVLAFDNSSAGYEAAALGIPVVALNAPWYRKQVHHGLRFWDAIPGPDVDNPEDLAGALEEAQTPAWALRRAEITDAVYPPATRGRAADLAVGAITEWWSR